MGRIITDKKIAEIHELLKANPESIGLILGSLIVDNNVPIKGVASLLAVSEPTIYRWMYGDCEPRDEDKIRKIKQVITTLRKARRANDLPLMGPMEVRITSLVEIVKTHRPLRASS